MLKLLINELMGDRTLYSVALEYGILRDGERPERPDRYAQSIAKMLAQPEKAQFQNLATLFQVFGVDIRAAIAIAASQVKPKE
jgi:hypothetical protein